MNGVGVLPDASDRRAATTVFDRNIVVEAGAGTGKTSLLVERLLVAIGSGRARLDRIAAITFTEKAAGEMRERLGDGLETLRSIAAQDDRRPAPKRATEADRAYAFLNTCPDAPGDDLLQGRVLDALHLLDRATVTTMHGFCAELLRMHPFDADLSPEFEIDPGTRFAAEFRDAWESFLAREFGARGTRSMLWTRVLGVSDLATVEQVARALSRSGTPAALLANGASWPDARALFGSQAATLAAGIEELLAAVPKLGFKARTFLDAALPALRHVAERGVDPDLRAALGAPPLAGTAPAKNKTIPAEREREFAALVAETRGLLGGLARVDDARVRDLVAAADPFVREYRERLLASGSVGFDGLLSLTRDLLRGSLPVREAVKARFPMLLVDEFQDTDPMQYEIVLLLAERPGGTADDPFEAELGPGRLFIVGDPKQSIYRFRGADFSAYERAVSRVTGQGGLPLALTANFRAVPEVLGSVNDLFDSPAASAWSFSDYQPPYRAIDPVRASTASGVGIELWSVLPAGALAPERRDAEGRLVARRIREIRADEGRPWKDFTILLRAFSEVARTVRPLRDAGIPFVVTGGRTFHERTEVVRFLAHLRLLASPGDPPALLAWLRSPAGAVPDGELADWAGEGGAWNRKVRPDPARWPHLARAFEEVRGLEESVRDLPLDALVRRTLERSFLAIVEGFAFEGAQRVANIGKLAARACELARDGSMTLVGIVDALEDRSRLDPEGESPLADENTDAVRVMTIHAAKGLEAPVVFLPDLARQEHHAGGDDVRVGVLYRPDGAALALKAGKARNAARVALDREDDLHGEAEDVRLLYVALTRARDRLVLLAGKPKRGATPPWIAPLRAWGYGQDALPADGALLSGGRVVHRVLLTPPEAETAEARPIAGAPSAVAAYERAIADLSSGAGSLPLRSPSGLTEEGEAIDDRATGEAALDRDPARAVGIAVHALLERWRPGSPFGSEGIAAAAAAAAAAHGCDPAEVGREVTALLDGFETTPFAGILAEATTVLREFPVLFGGENGAVWRGRADLIYRRPDGDWVVADFKTDADADESALEARYAPQLRVYARALRGAARLPETPRAELWLLRHRTIVAVAV